MKRTFSLIFVERSPTTIFSSRTPIRTADMSADTSPGQLLACRRGLASASRAHQRQITLLVTAYGI